MKRAVLRKAQKTTLNELSWKKIYYQVMNGKEKSELTDEGIKHKSLILAQDERWRRA